MPGARVPGTRARGADRFNTEGGGVSVAPPLSRRRDLGRRFRGGGSLSARTVRGPQQLDLSARDRWRGRSLFGGRRCAALTAPLIAAPR